MSEIELLREKLNRYELALFKIFKSEYSDMNQSVYECSSILANIAQDALGLPYMPGDFSIADRYEWESRGDWTQRLEVLRIGLKRKIHKDDDEIYNRYRDI